LNRLTTAGLTSAIGNVECCGDGIVQSDNGESCDLNDINCSLKCTLCTPNTTMDCNCQLPTPCNSSIYGLCLNNGSCVNDTNTVLSSMCGSPMPFFTTIPPPQPSTSSSTSITTSNYTTNAPVPTATWIDPNSNTNCQIHFGFLTCGQIANDIQIFQEILVPYNLTINGATLYVNASTKIHVSGYLILKNNSKLTMANNSFLNHLSIHLFYYNGVIGTFSNTTMIEQNPCYSKFVTYAPLSLSYTFVNPCDDQVQIGKKLY